MLKYFKMIMMFKDVRAEVKAQGTLKNIVLSRKFWGALWVIAAFVLTEYFGVTIDANTQEMITNSIVVGISSAMMLFGAVMQMVSYYKTIKAKFDEAKAKAQQNG